MIVDAAPPATPAASPARRVLVTGATGMIGRHALEALARRGDDVHAVCRGEPPLAASPRTPPVAAAVSHSPVSWHRANLLACDEASALLGEVRASHWLHFAWNTEPGRFWTAIDNLEWLAASLHMFRAFCEAGGVRAVFAGTCAEYRWQDGARGNRPTDVLSESSPLAPRTLYGTAKNALRACVEAAAPLSNVSTAWGRVFFAYGPGESPQRFVPGVVTSLLAGRPALCTEGSQVRDFMHAYDIGRAFVAVLDSDWRGAVNIASGQGAAVRDVASKLGEIIGRRDLVRLGARPAPAGEPARIVADVSVLRDRIGFRAHYDLDEGLAATVRWWAQSSVLPGEYTACGDA